MISFRYVPVVCVLVALALVPTLIHSYSDEPTHAGWNPSAIPDVLEGFVAAPSDRNPTWGKRRFDSDEWLEREYNSGRDDVRLTIIRSLDHKALYHHPELAVAYGPRFGSSFEKYEVVRFEHRPDIPVHVMHPAAGGSAMAFYVLYYDGEFVENPLWFQVRTAGELLFSHRKPMTLFFAHDLAVPDATSVESLPSVRLLFAAIERFAQSQSENTVASK